MFQNLKHPRVRAIAGLVVVAVLAAAAYVGARATAKKSPAAAATSRLVAATVGTMSQTVSASGTLAPADTNDLSFSSSGTVTAVKVKAGQKVTQGQVLATIDSASLASAVVQAEAQVTADQSTIDSDEDDDASSAQLSADRATLASDQSQLAAAQTALAGASLVSPITGVVSAVNLTVGQQLGSNGASGTTPSGSDSGAGPTNPTASDSSNSSSDSSSAQITVVSTSLVVNLNVDDTEISDLKIGQTATVSPSSASSGTGGGGNGFRGLFGGAFPGGNANQDQTKANSSSSSSNGNSTTATTPTSSTAAKVTSVGAIASASSGVAQFPVVVTVTGAATGLYSGATAQATITYKEIANAVQVPTLAITQTNGQSYVTVSANGKTVKRVVTTGITSGGEVQITSGLTGGEQVVVAVPTAARGTNGSTRTGTNGEFPGGGNFTPPGGGSFRGFGQ
jgi:multidrug efflux pump subunit AcrA (membrane-fusion protein)